MTEEIHFVTGKGGTGKSVIAAGLAFREARKGRETLLVELGDRSFYKDFFGLSEVGYQPRPLEKNLDVALWSGAECLREYAQHLIKVESLTKLFFENSVSRGLIDIAPALPELAILGKATGGPRGHGPKPRHRVIVIDAYATGHFMALLRAPRGMAEAVRFGPMGEQSRGIDAVIRDPKWCRTHLVSLPEEMPVQETLELATGLRTEFGIEPSLILNKVVPVPEGVPPSDHPFAVFIARTAERQKAMRERLTAGGLQGREVPFVTEDDPRALIATLAGALS